jgi:hypothetical protein
MPMVVVPATAALPVSVPLVPTPMSFAAAASLATSFATSLFACRGEFGCDGVGVDATAQH